MELGDSFRGVFISGEQRSESHTVNNSSVSEPHAGSGLGQIVGDIGHGLHTSGEHHVAVSGLDAQRGDHHSLHARRAHLIDGGARRVQRQLGAEDGLAGGSLSDTGLAAQNTPLNAEGTELIR